MIGKISIGKSFGGCLRYCLEDKQELSHEQKLALESQDGLQHENRAEVLEYNMCFGNKKELVSQFNDVRTLRPNVISVLFALVLTLINLPFPHFFDYLQLLVYAYYGYKLANIRNMFADEGGVTESDVKEFKSFGFSLVVMTNLLMALTQFYSTIVGLWLVYNSFADGKIIQGILVLIFGIALISWLLTSIFGFIAGLLMLIFKVDKKYFGNE